MGGSIVGQLAGPIKDVLYWKNALVSGASWPSAC
jgi:hypothetical protein